MMPSKTKAANQPYKPSASCSGIGLQLSLWNAPTRIANRSRRGASGKSNTSPTFLVHPQMRSWSQSPTSSTMQRSVLADYRRHKENLRMRFNAGKKEQLWYYGELVKVFTQRRPEDALVNEFARVVKELKDLDQAG
jgi:hypothetical protein